VSAFAFQRTGDANYPRKMKVLVMGPPKSGKTTFISTAPNVVVADVEAGLMSIAHLNVPFVTIDSTEKLQTLLLILGDEKLRKQSATQMGLPDIESVAIDTTDALQELMKKEILKEQRRTQMQQADWGTLKERMASVLKAFCALKDVNVIFTCHVDITQDENQKQIYAPGLQGAIKNEIAGYVDFSLMSGRRKETDAQGVSKINYFLKNEGDDKNPHLGNRAQGRVPEECEPNFMTLQRLTFAGINVPMIQEEPEQVVIQTPVPTPVAAPEPEKVAQSVSTPAVAPTGVPATDSDDPINAAGITMLTKEYATTGLAKPADLDSWTLGKARSVARMFVAWKADMAAEKSDKNELIELIKSLDAFAGEVETPVETPEAPKKAQKKAAAEVAQDAPDADTSSTPETEATEEEALATVTEQLGGVVLGQEINAEAKCSVCNEQVDDVDIAQLGWNRFNKILCVTHYKDETRK
jgi:hypothetical protein